MLVWRTSVPGSAEPCSVGDPRARRALAKQQGQAQEVSNGQVHHRPAHVRRHQARTHRQGQVENRTKGTTGEKTRAEMVKWIEDGGDARVANGSSYVEVQVVDATPEYIQTYADGIWTDNLLALPEY